VRIGRFFEKRRQPRLVGNAARFAVEPFDQPFCVPAGPVRVLPIGCGKGLVMGGTNLTEKDLPGLSQAITGIFSIASRTFSSG